MAIKFRDKAQSVVDDPVLTPEEQAVLAAFRAQQTADTNALGAARQMPRARNLVAMTPAETLAYLDARYPLPAANLTAANAILASMKEDIGTIAVIAGALGRRIFR